MNFIKNCIKSLLSIYTKIDDILLTNGKLLSNQQHSLKSIDLKDYEFKIYSQFGDDGIIQYLIKNISIENETFIEFGVENYSESNTKFLLMNNNWSGFVIDGSKSNIKNIKKNKWFWKYDLNCLCEFITKDNINQLLDKSGFKNLGILHIDIDGVDFHVLEAIDFIDLNPSILILEYNSVFGSERAITVPYNEKFIRTNTHHSNLYFGASLKALTYLADKKGYSLIGCNSAGNNAYYIKKELLNEQIKSKTTEEAFVLSKFREERDKKGRLTFNGSEKRLDSIKGLKVINVVTLKEEIL
jgi:hypothetical protein